MQQVTSATSNERILQRITGDFLQRVTSAMSNERILQRVTSDFLQRVTSDFFQRATSTTSNELKCFYRQFYRIYILTEN